MECKPTFISRGGAFTLVEMMMAVTLASLLAVVLVVLYMYSTRSFVELANFSDLDNQSRMALNRLSRTVREADAVTDFRTNQITVQIGTNAITFRHVADQRKLLRESATGTDTLLTDCDAAVFSIYQPPATGASYESFSAATTNNCKMVQVTWTCSKTILGRTNVAVSTSAKVVLRN